MCLDSTEILSNIGWPLSWRRANQGSCQQLWQGSGYGVRSLANLVVGWKKLLAVSALSCIRKPCQPFLYLTQTLCSRFCPSSYSACWYRTRRSEIQLAHGVFCRGSVLLWLVAVLHQKVHYRIFVEVVKEVSCPDVCCTMISCGGLVTTCIQSVTSLWFGYLKKT